MSGERSGGRHDVLVVGSGPAGWTAAIYAARAGLQTLIFTGLQSGGPPGGQLMLTSDVENFPGFDDGILGPDLMARMRRQAERFGVDVIEDDVTRVDLKHRPLIAEIGRGPAAVAYEGEAMIVATGASALWLELPSETRLRGRGVSSCATCDGFFFRDQEVAVVGGGDTALEEAIELTRHAAKVTVIHRRDAPRASRIMQDRARANPKIAWALEHEVVEVLGDARVEGVRVRHVATGEQSTLPLAGVFVAIGHRPNTDLFRGQLELDQEGYLTTTERTATNIGGVFVAGDVHDRRYRQAVTAAADGCKAALDAAEYLASLGPREFDVHRQSTIKDRGDLRHLGTIAAPRGVTVEVATPSIRPPVVVYTTTWCGDCKVAKRYLAQRGVEYHEVDIEATPGAAELIERWSGGYRTVPTFDVGGRIVVDFDPEALDAALAT